MEESIDPRNIKEIELLEQILGNYGEMACEASQITRLENIFRDTKRIGYFPVTLLTLNIRGLDGKTYENQPVVFCDGFKDEAVIWEVPKRKVPGQDEGHPDFRLYTYKIIKGE